MTRNSSEGVTYSIDEGDNFISSGDSITSNVEILDLWSTVGDLKSRLFEGLKTKDDLLYREILTMTKRFDDIIEKVIKL
jgi:hypothetical protein